MITVPTSKHSGVSFFRDPVSSETANTYTKSAHSVLREDSSLGGLVIAPFIIWRARFGSRTTPYFRVEHIALTAPKQLEYFAVIKNQIQFFVKSPGPLDVSQFYCGANFGPVFVLDLDFLLCS